MRLARDFRETAWNTLRGRYWWTVLAGLIASILGGYSARGSIDFNFRTDSSNFWEHLQRITHGQIDAEQLYTFVRPFMGVAAAFAGLFLVYSIAVFIVGSAVELGYNRFNVSLYEGTSVPKIDLLFSCFSNFGNALLLRLLMLLKILAWTLLFIVPGIVAALRYALAPYILAENPDLSASDAIERSKELMNGHKWRLFCLKFSFIGWALLAALTGGIGSVFLAPYIKAADTAFYLERTDRLPYPEATNTYSSPYHTTPGSSETKTDGRELI